ncbi:MAG TPA: BON domain-containing protein [Gemmatimonadaceae bacterium]|jgi:osmotically-inducible protein OsmY|nr:BON domain-containing protein [Gemmatimonadaceae bacterium]HTD59532.1 BON domain-containing protein [Gemmatimonadaceae bacterium]
MISGVALRTAIVSQLRGTLGSDAGRVKVNVFNGVLVLRGNVDSLEMQDVVLRTVRSLKFVTAVVAKFDIIDRRGLRLTG